MSIEIQTKQTDNKDNLKEEKKDNANNASIEYKNQRQKIPAWLSCELRLDDFNIKNQAFTITGWINVFFKWDKAPAKLQQYDGVDDFEGYNSKSDDANKSGIREQLSKMGIFKNTLGEDIVKVYDLRESSISYYLPIDSDKIFFQPSLQSIKYIEPPYLLYNKATKITHTQYYVTASLLETLELFLYPFDQQFLNIKLRWNIDYFRILDFDTEKKVPVDYKWWGADSTVSCKRKLELFHHKPLQIQLKETIQHEVDMFPAWIDFRSVKKYSKKVSGRKSRRMMDDSINKENNLSNLRFALIRLRISRNPMYFVTNVIFPFFIIVSCSFSVYAVPVTTIGDRLGVAVTILLTFTAFQSFISEQLPETSSMLLIDWYITIAYTLQALIILSLCVTSILAVREDDGDDLADFIDTICGSVLGGIWAIFSCFYISLKFSGIRNCYDKLCCCCCCRKVNFNDWDERADAEIEEWSRNERDVYCFDKILRDND